MLIWEQELVLILGARFGALLGARIGAHFGSELCYSTEVINGRTSFESD